MINALSIFQKYINSILKDFLNEFVSTYLNDILIFITRSLENHRSKINKILQRLREVGLQIDIDKCEFEIKSIKYLSFIIEAGNDIRMNSVKIQTILNLERSQSIKRVRSFLSFVNFYRRFIRDFSKIASSLISLIRKDVTFK